MNAPLAFMDPAAAGLQIGGAAARALSLELDTWPKPGLVSPFDCGSHDDMDAAMLLRSIAVLEPFLINLAEAGAAEADMATLRRIGIAAEAAMLRATRGVNTHRGAIFGLGLLCAACGATANGLEPKAARLGNIVRSRWGAAIRHMPVDCTSHGAVAVRRYGARGARLEAASGFPSVYEVGLPALRAGLALSGGDAEAARVQACFALIAVLDDTNLLHRGGSDGLAFARREARHFLESGGVGLAGWRDRAAQTHRAFVERHLSPGGAADVLAMALFVCSVEGRLQVAV
ncbi:triphosphoribosyl-dephospho-CoA synthase MdcB [Lichenifustis flavocetrariae]|uniref:Probable 2-(5''-triphosphoribosyl)-3'-dephosphocoenzyme-A synthase n=1 Tax=Lichenifustis flavocetrariae TaxID=2949735 RepID=A0AA41Z8D0_9HYPH|nr:triphosphoribosyl-dephospho-CoA synthase MdcB [Lichenifustis flavocetrariae]MCW6512220.1 triphosphoribosyl-dephospho-CoA synthase MdcB [Lichenifustis flavocetrariae]